MTTASEYRQYAQECIQSAREAHSAAVRKQFLDLAKFWMAAAERMDARSAPSHSISKGDGRAPPNPAAPDDQS
jgi:hypothetical protein